MIDDITQSPVTANQHNNTISYVSQYVPLWVGIADLGSPQAEAVTQSFLGSGLIQPGGIATSTFNSTQQWDFPNCWAPLQASGLTLTTLCAVFVCMCVCMLWLSLSACMCVCMLRLSLSECVSVCCACRRLSLPSLRLPCPAYPGSCPALPTLDAALHCCKSLCNSNDLRCRLLYLPTLRLPENFLAPRPLTPPPPSVPLPPSPPTFLLPPIHITHLVPLYLPTFSLPGTLSPPCPLYP